ncbi:hypothetical protein [Nonomuraea africana]|uniref:Cell shape-determining protein MreD n=1 Tax=Nonomuraea africana TaxID=46171 RepID=A0ABR9KGS4_9ACTN|nr:hypothetical protein [Nonomuraea africana]MBE1561215.1 cell shape-determining protein MreD [Nonomuraea africana]
MLAIVAAIVFGLGFLLDLLNTQLAGISGIAFVLLGLCLLALHQAGIGTASLGSYKGGWRRTRR